MYTKNAEQAAKYFMLQKPLLKIKKKRSFEFLSNKEEAKRFHLIINC